MKSLKEFKLKFQRTPGPTMVVATLAKSSRVVERHVMYRDRADGSQAVMDVFAMVERKGPRHTASLLVVFGTRAAWSAATHQGDYHISHEDALRYVEKSWAKVEVFKTESKVTHHLMNKCVKGHLYRISAILKDNDFWLPTIGKRNLKSPDGIRWHGIADSWRVPKSQTDAYNSRKFKIQEFKAKTKWVSETVDNVEGDVA